MWPNGPEQGVGQPERPPKDLLTESLEWLSTPAEAILTARERAASYRNDELIHILNTLYNTGPDPSFFTTVAFECSQDAALSWTLTRDEARRIVAGFYTSSDRTTKPPWIESRVQALKAWFGAGGF